jgi:hypothetical protein
MNSDDVKRLRMWHEAASRAEELTPLTNREISDLLAAAEERDRLRRDAKVVLDGAIRASVDRDRALTAARELREALEKQAVHRVSRRGGERQWCQICDSYTAPYSPAREEWLKVTHASGCALASTAWLTDGGDNG